MIAGTLYEIFTILQLGVGSLFMFVGFDTHSFILESVMHSVNERDPGQIDEYAGYYGLAVTHICYAFANLFAPVLISYIHPKWSLLFGSIGFTLYNAGFLYLNSFYFYFSSFIMGLGFAMFYCGQGCYASQHTSKSHLARNSSITWAVTCMSYVVGGIILIIVLARSQITSGRGHQNYSDAEIRAIFGGFTACALFSNIVFGLLPKTDVQNSICDDIPQSKKRSFGERLQSPFKAFGNSNIWWLCFSWFHLGIMTSEMLGVYPTALIFTESLKSSITTIVFYAFAISAGELTTAVVITTVSKKHVTVGRVPSYVMGSIVCFIACLLIVASTPRYSTLFPSTEEPLLFKTNFFVSILIGFLFGVTDGCFNTSRSCIIPLTLPGQRAEGFSISKVFQSFASCIIFFLSTMIDLYGHFIIMIIFDVLAAITFVITSRKYDRKKRARSRFGANGVSPSEVNLRMGSFR